MINLIDSLID